MNREGACILGLAKLLGWPHGVSVEHRSGSPLAVPGGEAGWRGWVDESWGSDEATSVYATLTWAKRMMDQSKAPGPPETWGNKNRLSFAALKGMDIEAEDWS